MSAPTSTAPRPPASGRRRVARGSALGMGVLVASGVAVPAALAADEDPTTGDAVLQTPEEATEVAPGAALEDWEPAEIAESDLTADFGVGKAYCSAPLS